MTDQSGVQPPAPPIVPTPKSMPNLPDAAKYVLALIAGVAVFVLVEQGKTDPNVFIGVVVAPILTLVGMKSAANSGAAAANAGNQAAANATPTTVVVQSPPPPPSA